MHSEDLKLARERLDNSYKLGVPVVMMEAAFMKALLDHVEELQIANKELKAGFWTNRKKPPSTQILNTEAAT